MSKTEPRDQAAPSRRELLSLLGSGVLASGLSGCAGKVAAGAMPPAESTSTAPSLAEPLTYSSTAALAHAIRTKQVSSEEVITAHLARIEAVNPKLNAVVQLAAERALAEARAADSALARGESGGPLHGVPMTIKDSFDTAGVVSTGGTQGRAAFVPRQDATVVARLRAAGAILLGKTNTPELTLSFETDNLVYGKTSNPYDLARTPGGSSGGAAAIVAAGGAPFDIGSDYGGSIRLPAHFCGIAGIKPSAGRVPRTGHIYPFGGVLDSLQQVGPLARCVDDLALLLPLIAGPDFVDPGIVPMPLGDQHGVLVRALRVSFHTDNGIRTPSRATIDTIRAAAQVLAKAGAAVEEARPTGIDQALDLAILYYADGGAAMRRLLAAAGTTEHTLGPMADATALSAVELDAWITRWYGFRSRMSGFLARHDVILSPVNAVPAMLHGATSDPDTMASFSYTFTYNLTGWPATVVRAGTSPEGLPIGIQVVAGPAREDVTLAVARLLEAELGGFRPPSL